MTRRIRKVVVVVPAHDEQELLHSCLESLRIAARRSPVPVRTVVVLDDCRDDTYESCRGRHVETVTITARNVGRARSAGADLALAGETDLATVWLANTDADTRVGPNWVADQVAWADRGADVLLGLVRLADVSPDDHQAYRSAYLRGIRSDGSHQHVHGANLGVRASAYRRVGGFPPVIAHEDRQFVRRLKGVPGVRVVTTSRLVVDTSPRLNGRCPEGFAATVAAFG